MNETLSRKRRLKFTVFFKKRNSKKNPKNNKPNVITNNTRNTTLPTKVSYLYKQKKHIHHSHDNHNNSKKRISRYASPNRKTMPQEIRIHPVAPDSPLSLVSNLTGDPALKDPSFKPPQSFPMLSGGLTSHNDDDAASSFSMEDLYVSRQLFQSHHDEETRETTRNAHSFARLQCKYSFYIYLYLYLTTIQHHSKSHSTSHVYIYSHIFHIFQWNEPKQIHRHSLQNPNTFTN